MGNSLQKYYCNTYDGYWVSKGEGLTLDREFIKSYNTEHEAQNKCDVWNSTGLGR